jgi:hypothetical protein
MEDEMGTALTIETPPCGRGKPGIAPDVNPPQPAHSAPPPRLRRPHHQWVDALVTLLAMACFATTLVAMAGEALA